MSNAPTSMARRTGAPKWTRATKERFKDANMNDVFGMGSTGSGIADFIIEQAIIFAALAVLAPVSAAGAVAYTGIRAAVAGSRVGRSYTTIRAAQLAERALAAGAITKNTTWAANAFAVTHRWTLNVMAPIFGVSTALVVGPSRLMAGYLAATPTGVAIVRWAYANGAIFGLRVYLNNTTGLTNAVTEAQARAMVSDPRIIAAARASQQRYERDPSAKDTVGDELLKDIMSGVATLVSDPNSGVKHWGQASYDQLRAAAFAFAEAVQQTGSSDLAGTKAKQAREHGIRRFTESDAGSDSGW